MSRLDSSNIFEQAVMKRYFSKTGEEGKTPQQAYEEISIDLGITPENASGIVKSVLHRIFRNVPSLDV